MLAYLGKQFDALVTQDLLARRDAPDAVHQLRVAARRLRSTLATFAPVVRDKDFDAVAAELRWLAKAYDQARELDVLSTEMVGPAAQMVTPPAALPALDEALAAALGHARRDATETAASERFLNVMLDQARRMRRLWCCARARLTTRP